MNDHILRGFQDEMEKEAVIGRGLKTLAGLGARVITGGKGKITRGVAAKRFAGAAGRRVRKRPGLVTYPAAAAGVGAAGLYGAHRIAEREKGKRKAVKRMLTGQYRPGAGMIVPPRSY